MNFDLFCAEYKKYVREMIWARIDKLGGGSYQCTACNWVRPRVKIKSEAQGCKDLPPVGG